MTHTGIDTAARITAAQAAKIKAEGLSFVGRYLVPESYGKALTAKEADALRSAGLAILLCWETTASRVKGGAAAGAADGDAARRCAEQLGVDPGAVIYFAADYDVPTADLASVEAYLRTAAYNTEQFEVGLYGGERVVSAMSAAGACHRFWQCCAWSNQFLPVASVRQFAWQGDARAKAVAKACGLVAVDLNAADSLAGLWLPHDAAEPEPWYAGAMAWAAAKGLMNDGRPNDGVTRGELATVLMRYDEKRFSGLLED